MMPRTWISTSGYWRRYRAKSAARDSRQLRSVQFAIRVRSDVGDPQSCAGGTIVRGQVGGSVIPGIRGMQLYLNDSQLAVDLLSDRGPPGTCSEVQNVVPTLASLPMDRAAVVSPRIDTTLPGVSVLPESGARPLTVHALAVVRDHNGLDGLKRGELEGDTHVIRTDIERIPNRLSQRLHRPLPGVSEQSLAHLDWAGRHTASHTTHDRHSRAHRGHACGTWGAAVRICPVARERAAWSAAPFRQPDRGPERRSATDLPGRTSRSPSGRNVAGLHAAASHVRQLFVVDLTPVLGAYRRRLRRTGFEEPSSCPVPASRRSLGASRSVDSASCSPSPTCRTSR